MSEQTTNNGPENLFNVKESVDATKETLDKFLDAARVEAAYGQPVTHGDTLIIPTAEIISGLGFGFGSGGGVGEKQPDKPDQPYGGGSGGGGGGKVFSRPVAVIIASPAGVRVEPIIDVTKMWMAALTTVGFMAGAYYRMRSHRRAHRQMKEQLEQLKS